MSSKKDKSAKGKEKSLKSPNSAGLRSEDLVAVLDAGIEENGLISHATGSFNSFITGGIHQIVTQLFEIEKSMANERKRTAEDTEIVNIKFHAKFTNVRVMRPVVPPHVAGYPRPLWPHEARSNDLNYSSLVSMDAVIVAKAILQDGNVVTRQENVNNFAVALPIMVGSEICHTSGLSRESKIENKEDRYDPGGYFIIGGTEWVISMIETRLFNSPHIFRNVGHSNEIARCEFLSKPGDAYENSSSIIIRYVNDGNITVVFQSYPQIKNLEIPFYVIFRILGMTIDKEIVDNIQYGYSEGDVVSEHIIRILRDAFRAPNPIFGKMIDMTDPARLLKKFAKIVALHGVPTRTYLSSGAPAMDESVFRYVRANGLKILDKYLFPHIGLSSESRHDKLRYFGHLIHKMLLVEMQIVNGTDRDSLKNKRINGAGHAYAKAFKTFFNLNVVQAVKKKLTRVFRDTPFSQVQLAQTFKNAISAPDLEKAMIQAITTGNKEINLRNRQISNRLASENLHRKNQLNFLSTLRVIRTQSTSTAKQDQRSDEMRRAHPSYAGFIDPFQTADTGDPVGLVKQASLSAYLAEAGSSELLKRILLSDPDITPLQRILPAQIYRFRLVKILVNGDWVGCARDAPTIVHRYREMRRGYKFNRTTGAFEHHDIPEIDPKITIYWDVDSNEINFWIDVGRLLRPMLVVRNNGELDSIGREMIGTAYDPFKDPPLSFDKNGNPEIIMGSFVQDVVISQKDIEMIFKKKISINALHARGLIDYISPEEMENLLVAYDLDVLKRDQTNPLMQYTHCEIPAAILGLPAMTCPYLNFNQSPRVTFQTNQSKQTCGWYSLSWPWRVDKHAFLQYYCEAPIIKTLANKYLYPNGMNAIVAIACYGGYNQEDSLEFNSSANQRGLFLGDQMNYKKTILEKGEKFGNPDAANTKDISKHANYEHLEAGFVPPGFVLHRDDVMIGKSIELIESEDNYHYKDTSIVYRHAEPALVEGHIRGCNQRGENFIKVKYSSTRVSGIGDKYCFPLEAELLTNGGWTKIRNLRDSDKIACLVDEKLIYQVPTRRYIYYHKGPMYHLKSDDVEIMCTLNHKLYVKLDDQKYEFIEAQNALGRQMTIRAIVETQNDDRSDGMTMFWKNFMILLSKYIEWKAENNNPDFKIFTALYHGSLFPFWNLGIHDITMDSGRYYVKIQNSIWAREIPQYALHTGYWAIVRAVDEKNLVEVVIGTCDFIVNNGCQNDKIITEWNDQVGCVEVPGHIMYYRAGPHSAPMWISNSSRHGQKGMGAFALNQADMLFTESGLVPDLVLSPFAIPSRMTVGQMLESQGAKACALRGCFGDATAFRKVDIEAVGDELESFGYERYGTERMFNGITGEWIDTRIFIAPTYYQRLQKFVADEVYSISTGPTCIITRQPLEGKAHNGGLRIGEMEASCLAGNGLGHFLMEKFRDDSDGFDIYICRNCGSMPAVNEHEGIVICKICSEMGMDPAPTKVRSTWSSKLFMQELESANVGVKFTVEPYEYETFE